MVQSRKLPWRVIIARNNGQQGLQKSSGCFSPALYPGMSMPPSRFHKMTFTIERRRPQSSKTADKLIACSCHSADPGEAGFIDWGRVQSKKQGQRFRSAAVFNRER
jgi:hypothetical protein